MTRGYERNEVIVTPDGDSYCAHFNDFVNLQVSDCVFDGSPRHAIERLLTEYPMKCNKALWSSFGGDAGLCGEKAYGQAKKGTEYSWVSPACEGHGGPTLEEAVIEHLKGA